MADRRKFDTKFFDLDIDTKSAVPIYEQIKNAVKIAIFSNKLKKDDKIISIRDISTRFNINPITIMKAYNQLETEGFLLSRRGSGYYVIYDYIKPDKNKNELFQREVTRFLNKITDMGYSAEDLMNLLKNKMEEDKND